MEYAADLVLVDIDNTLTAGDILVPSTPGDPHFGNQLLALIARHLAAARGLPQAEADRLIRRFADDLIWWDYPDFIAEFDLDATRLWPELEACNARLVRPQPDAVAMVRRLHAAGIPLAVMSNNPITGCLLKLQAIGLGDRYATPWFCRLFAANNLRGQKSVPAMWRRCLAHLALPPDRVVIVGDNPRDDAAVPAQVGIRQSILVDRTQSADAEERDGAVCVRDLRLIEVVSREPGAAPDGSRHRLVIQPCREAV